MPCVVFIALTASRCAQPHETVWPDRSRWTFTNFSVPHRHAHSTSRSPTARSLSTVSRPNTLPAGTGLNEGMITALHSGEDSDHRTRP